MNLMSILRRGPSISADRISNLKITPTEEVPDRLFEVKNNIHVRAIKNL